MLSLVTPLAGVTFEPGYPRNLVDLVERARHDGLVPLELVRDLDNPADLNATAVRLEGRRLGWLPSAVAAHIGAELDAGQQWHAYLLLIAVHPEHRERPGVRVLLTPEPIEETAGV